MCWPRTRPKRGGNPGWRPQAKNPASAPPADPPGTSRAAGPSPAAARNPASCAPPAPASQRPVLAIGEEHPAHHRQAAHRQAVGGSRPSTLARAMHEYSRLVRTNCICRSVAVNSGGEYAASSTRGREPAHAAPRPVALMRTVHPGRSARPTRDRPSQRSGIEVLADGFKLTSISTTMYPRLRLILCLGDPLAAGPFLPGARPWAAGIPGSRSRNLRCRPAGRPSPEPAAGAAPPIPITTVRSSRSRGPFDGSVLQRDKPL